MMIRVFCLVALTIVALVFARLAFAADRVNVCTARSVAAGPVYLAQERGYFERENLLANIVFVDEPRLVGEVLAAGKSAFCVSDLGVEFYNVAGNGTIRIIAGGAEEAPDFEGLAIVASNAAYKAGLKTIKDISGHSFGISDTASLREYAFHQLAERYGFDERNVQRIAFDGISNLAKAIIGNRLDASIIEGSFARPLMQEGTAKLLSWYSDQASMQLSVLAVSAETADRIEMTSRFLNAYRAGAKDYHDAFVGRDDFRLDWPDAPQVYAILARYTQQPIDLLKHIVTFIDPDTRVNIVDVFRQIAWLRSREMVKPEVDAAKILDKRYVSKSAALS